MGIEFILQRHQKQQRGFTIVELLIVIVVIAILAAIVIVAYNGIQARAHDAAAKSDLDNFRKKIEMAKIDASDGLYPSVPTAAMGIRVSKSNYTTAGRNNWYYCVTADRSQYALGIAITPSNSGYIITSSGSTITKSTVWGADTCAAIGVGSWNGQVGYSVDSSSWASWAKD